MPITLGPDAANARQAASLFRVLANPTRLAILLTLQTAEQRITDLTARLGGSQANISAHLIRLRQAGVITKPDARPRCLLPPHRARARRPATGRRAAPRPCRAAGRRRKDRTVGEKPSGQIDESPAGTQLKAASGDIKHKNLQVNTSMVFVMRNALFDAFCVWIVGSIVVGHLLLK